MNFRTEIDMPSRPVRELSRTGKILMLGSCFTDNIGSRLEHDGFDVVHNPLGPLYNPASIAETIKRASQSKSFCKEDFIPGQDGRLHCLWFASKYQHESPDKLAENVNTDFSLLCQALSEAETVIITLGTSYCFRLNSTATIVGNCHKFPAADFTRFMLTQAQTRQYLNDIVSACGKTRNVIFTVSPVRHTADGLHGNQISKANLLLAVDDVMSYSHAPVFYFPAYEILIDDLRDYRFYAADMKHPSEVAADYVYDVFCHYYFSPQTINQALGARKEYQRKAHRPIID